MSRLLLLALCFISPLQASNLSLEWRISKALDTPNLSGEAVWLEADGIRFLGIYSPSKAKLSLGGAVILHDAGSHADWQEVIQPLRLHLSTQGWNTLAIQLPAVETKPDPSVLLSLLEEASPRIQKAIEYFNPQQQPSLVLVGHGLGAAMALHHVAKQANQQVAAIAAISLSIDTENDAAPVSAALAQLQLPILDLFGSRDLVSVIDSAEKRRQIAFRNKHDRYRQEQIQGANHFFTGLQSSLSQRIHGWLKRVTTDQANKN
jgi:pimeloyl-ACP methyl ester carboxylesterase